MPTCLYFVEYRCCDGTTELPAFPAVLVMIQINRMSLYRDLGVEDETTAGIAGVRCVLSAELVVKDRPIEGFERTFI